MAEDETARLLEKLDIGQKIRLLTGASNWRTYAEPAVGLRPLTMSDGPAGVRGETWDERRTSLVLPSPTALAASWDEELVRDLGGLLATEARRKGVQVLLAPTLNLHRSPLGGRHFECFSEDPLLTARTGVAFVKGVQEGGVAATAKHFVANDAETDRLHVDVRVTERALRELYLAPFEAAVEAGVWAVMSAYNKVNGVTMSASPLLEWPLKGDRPLPGNGPVQGGWGFDGLVVSDWGAVRSLLGSARSGQDLAMPGPESPWAAGLLAAVTAGLIDEARIDDKVRRLLRLARRVGALGEPAPLRRPLTPPTGERALLRRAVAAGTVLLRNERDVLPLDPARLRRVAVIGPQATAVRIQGGGSAEVFPSSVVTPLEGIEAALGEAPVEAGDGDRPEVTYTPGLPPHTRPRPLDPAWTRDPRGGEPGVLVRLLDAHGTELHAEHRLSGRIVEPARVAGAVTVEISALVRPAQSGSWTLGVGGWGLISLSVDGRTLLSDEFPLDSDDPTRVHVSPPYRCVRAELTEGVESEVVARRRLDAGTGVATLLAAAPPPGDAPTALAAAEAAARAADVAVVVVGTTQESESEGRDRDSLALPDGQDALVRAVVRANPRTVVLVNSGGPVAMPWHREVPALLLAWFPGQEAGHGLADVLFGRAEPGGRLPTTWALAEEDVPVLDTRPRDGRLPYEEGVHIGHRAWLRAGARPAYWFGHGLGYTTWAYEGMEAPSAVSGDGAGVEVRVRLRNTGPRRGREVVQVYAARTDTAVDRPVRALAGYASVEADPGEEAVATVRLAARALSHWSTDRGRWETEPGAFTLLAGSSAGQLPLRTTLTVAAPGPLAPDASMESALR
ncbi:glycoside hydrolase family 3 C-terminal domain-containing protein [Streptomyces sp. IB2014 016-6]|uniref:glycoside hydrolase family 3 C-terminal domain-containing protein n=1 Tax=Streptomyces sp. IB2014 016-6 TaxID=2517818 RepID=UPI0011C8ACA6|nr:glycoside hydrolase family 3 C-terminal domain-containing protein [Streptomyces sp. IB2014 016-6]TXL85714.1 glycosyl hydrolase [Streptomyces sp. IB2014 016-6]